MGNKNSVGYTREKSWNWKGGELGENHLVRKSVEYSLWRNNIFNKDNYVCQGCGVKGGKLEAHHLYSFADNKEFRFEIWNGQTLCKECHRHLHNELGRR